MFCLCNIPLWFISFTGASSSFCTITSQFFLHKSSKRLSPYLLKFQSGLENWWQVEKLWTLYAIKVHMFIFFLNHCKEKWFVFNSIDRLHLFWALFSGLSCPPSCLGRTVLWQASPLFSRLLEELWSCLEPGWQEDVPGILYTLKYTVFLILDQHYMCMYKNKMYMYTKLP